MLDDTEKLALQYAVRAFKLAAYRSFDTIEMNNYLLFWRDDIKPAYDAFLSFSTKKEEEAIELVFPLFEALRPQELGKVKASTIAAAIIHIARIVVLKVEDFPKKTPWLSNLSQWFLRYN